MNYQKPEVLPLGSATLLILGNKHVNPETGAPLKLAVPDADLDD